MTPDEIEAGLKVCDAATPGDSEHEQWFEGSPHKSGHVPVRRDGPERVETIGVIYSKEDADFVIYARTALPRALRGLKEAQEEIAHMKTEFLKTVEFLRAQYGLDQAQLADLQAKALHASEAERKVTEDRNRLFGLRLEDEGRIEAARKLAELAPHGRLCGWSSVFDDGENATLMVSQGNSPCECIRSRILAALAVSEPTENQADHLRSLKPNWDRYGGVVISEAAISAALAVLGSRGQLTPRSNGGAQIDWQNAEISFGPDGEQEFDAAPAATGTTQTGVPKL